MGGHHRENPDILFHERRMFRERRKKIGWARGRGERVNGEMVVEGRKIFPVKEAGIKESEGKLEIADGVADRIPAKGPLLPITAGRENERDAKSSPRSMKLGFCVFPSIPPGFMKSYSMQKRGELDQGAQRNAAGSAYDKASAGSKRASWRAGAYWGASWRTEEGSN